MMVFSDKSIQKFIEDDILSSNDIFQILDKCENQSEKGFVYERL
jgi:hypothetical protein